MMCDSPYINKPKDRTVAEIQKLAKQRANRRKSAEDFKRKRIIEIKKNEKLGQPGDVDFQRMIRCFQKYQMSYAQKHSNTGEVKINVVTRKRPVSDKELMNKDFDSVSVSNPCVWVHNCKLKVDGITKHLNNYPFMLDHAFDENVDNELVYNHTAKYLVDFAINGGRATCFAYGQTGSGKTYTMSGVQSLAAQDVFKLIDSPQHRDKDIEVHCAFFELYGGRCVDLLHDRRVCAIREDGKGRVQIESLGEIIVSDESELLDLIEKGMNARTTHATEMNNDSSRSHAICQIALRKVSARDGSEPYGKLSLIDLAGSERGQDTKHHNRQRRQESAEINKSLLALKECVRALDSGSSHVPYRGSKLTMVLKDSFSVNARTVMISCISPVASSSDHTLNTLRYADRVKEKSGKNVTEFIENNRRCTINDPSCDSSDFQESNNDDDEFSEDQLSLSDEPIKNNNNSSSDGEEEEDSDHFPPPPPVTQKNIKINKNAAVSSSRHVGRNVNPINNNVTKSNPSSRNTAATSSRVSKNDKSSNKQPLTHASKAPSANNDRIRTNISPLKKKSISSGSTTPKNSKISNNCDNNSSAIKSKIPIPSTSINNNNNNRKLWDDPSRIDKKSTTNNKNSSIKREPFTTRNNQSFNENNKSPEKKKDSNLVEPKKRTSSIPLPATNKSFEKMQKEQGKTNVSLDEQIKILVEKEEDLFRCHVKAIQLNADMLTKEGHLLTSVQNDEDEMLPYLSQLDKLLTDKMELMTNLQQKVKDLKHLHKL